MSKTENITCHFDNYTHTFEYLGPEDLKPYDHNARTHAEKQIKKLIKSLRRFGFVKPLLIDENGVLLAGHAVLEAAIRSGLKIIPVIRIYHLSETEKRAYRLADNRIQEDGEWDPEKLKAEVEIILQDITIEITDTGFETAEIDLLFEENTEEDSEAELKESDLPNGQDIISRTGDLWLLGKHRLFCGDALDQNTYALLMGSSLARMCFTDPPYNVKVNGHIRTQKSFDEFAMASGEMSKEAFTGFLRQFLKQTHEFIRDGSIVYVCMDWRHIDELMCAGQDVFGSLKQLCVWAKDNGGMGSFYRSQHELVFVFKKGKASHINNFELGQNGRYRTNIWQYKGVNSFGKDREDELSMHPTVKPVQMVADSIMDCSNHHDIILDPFCGSGTTIIAAEQTNRICHAIELDPTYIDVIIRRWQRLYDAPVILEATGQSFEEILAERLEQEEGADV